MAERTPQVQERQGVFSRLRDRRQTKAARTVIEGALDSSPEVIRHKTKEAIDRAIGRAAERTIKGRNNPTDLRTMSHSSRVHERQVRTLTVSGARVGFPDDEATGFLATAPDSAGGKFDWTEGEVYVAHYPAEGQVRLEPLTPKGLADMGDQDLTRLHGLADQVLVQEDTDRTRAGIGAITVF